MHRVVRWIGSFTIAAVLAGACSSDPAPSSSVDDAGPTTVAPDESTDTPTVAEGEPVVTDDGVSDGVPPDPDATPLPISDEIRTGVLDNGLTWYVRSNDAPGSQVAMRLVVRAGARLEDPVGTGVAHFLEHMMFNGTERFPGNELDAALRGIGAEIGPDFNAYTSDNETVYQIAVEDRANNVEIAADVLAEWAARATLDPAEVAAEAPVIREEARLRDDDGNGIIGKAFEEAYYRDTPLEGINVVGTEETINAITDDVLRAYYDTWYRPDNMAVIAVGDRSLDDLEDLIVDRFAELEPRGASTSVEPFVLDRRTEPLVDVVIEPTFGDSFVSVDYPLETWNTGTRDGVELFLMEVLLGRMMNERLNDGIAAGRIDLRTASAERFNQTRHLSYMGFNADAVDLESGTEVLMTEIERTIRTGFTSDEMERAVEGLRSTLEQIRATADSTQDGQHADQLVDHFLVGADLQAVDDSIDMDVELIDAFTIEGLNAHWAWALGSTAPIVLVVGPDVERVGEPADHLAAVERAAGAELGAVEDDVEPVDVLVAEPAPVKEASQSDLVRNDGVRLDFDNGASVLFVESDIAAGEVTVVTESPGGRSLLDDEIGALADVVLNSVADSGIGEWSPVQVRRHLSDRNAFVAPWLSDTHEGFRGSASTEDLEVLFQLIHGWVTEPRVDDVPLGQQVQFARDDLAAVELDAAFAADVALVDARTGGGTFAELPTEAQLDALDTGTAEALFRDRFDRLDQHIVVVVGDVDTDTVVDLARSWIGTLPSGDPERSGLPVPPGIVDVELTVGSGTASGSYRRLFTGTADETVRNRVLADLANSLLNDRLFTVIRERLGATYGGSAFVGFEEPGDGAELWISVDGDPDRLEEIGTAIDGELEAIIAGRIAADDFAEAVAVLESRYNFVNNGFFIQSLFDEARGDEAKIIDRRRQVEVLEALEPADLQAFLDEVIDEANAIEVRAT